ncbi:MAG TPA: GspMb/PilO family protein [Terriglobales bacterium]|jgi:type IV pilus assembly protein PilO
MADLKRSRDRLKVAIGALVLVDAIAIAMLLTPIAGMSQARQQEMRQLWQELKSREFAPWRGLDRKLPRAKQDIEDFYQQRFPTEESAIAADFGRVASQTGVRVSGVKYAVKDASIDGLERVEIDASLSGGYLELVRFINALERNKLFFLVDGIDLGSEQNGIVGLHLKVEAYLRST